MKEIITDEFQIASRCEEINTTFEAKLQREIVSELKSTIRKKDLTALSAPAIGYNKRIFCINFKDLEIKTFINPIIAHASGLTLHKETCTSIPGKQFLILRNSEIEVLYQTPTGKTQSSKLAGLAACVFQHELQHLEGIILSDIGFEVDDNFDSLSEEDKNEIVQMYLDSLDLAQQKLDSEINSDEELKQISDAIDFMTKDAKGEIEHDKE